MASHVRRNQTHLERVAVSASVASARGGPTALHQLTLRVAARTPHFVVLNKGHDERLDGAFDATIEKALYRDFPEVPKFRWIHQLDFATSGAMCVGLDKAATAMACRLFREKRVQKEYLALVHGHLPFHPAQCTQQQQQRRSDNMGLHTNACTFSKLDLLAQDIEEFERLRAFEKGTREQERKRNYPRGPRQGQAYFHMEQARLERERKQAAQELSEDDRAFLALTWHDLSAQEQDKYKQMGKEDKARFVAELMTFLDSEQAIRAQQRKYDQPDDPAKQGEPVAYIFDAPIADPFDGDAFHMRIGDRARAIAERNPKMAGKASTTIAFVLGHGQYLEQPVTKVLLRPLTGRRHQLRLHLSHHGFPIVGDVTYGLDESEDNATRMMLHAWRLWLNPPPEMQAKYGDLYFPTDDPFEEIVPSQREITTMTTATVSS